MQHDQGYIRSHWTPPSGDYLFRIALAAARATINKTMMQHVATLMAISMAVAVWRYYTPRIDRWRRFVAFLKATKHLHRASTRSDIIKGTHQRWLFWTFHHEKEVQLTCWSLITRGVWHIKLIRSTQLICKNTLLGWLNLQFIVKSIVFYDVSLPIIYFNIYKKGHRTS